VKKSFNIQKLLHRKSKHLGTKPMHPSKRPRMQPEASRFGGSHKCKQNKRNKLPCFIDRFVQCKSLVVYFREQRTDQLVDLWSYNQLQKELETHVGELPNAAGFLFLFRLQTSKTIRCNINDLELICKTGIICHIVLWNFIHRDI
jgi:hypothetical protein